MELTARHGTAALYELSNHDLQYWYHVDKLGNAELQARYIHEHGVYAHRFDLVRWLPPHGGARSAWRCYLRRQPRPRAPCTHVVDFMDWLNESYMHPFIHLSL